MATSEKQGIPAVEKIGKKGGPVFVKWRLQYCWRSVGQSRFFYFSRSRNSSNLRCYSFFEVSWPSSMATGLCSVNLVWQSPLGAKMKPQVVVIFILGIQNETDFFSISSHGSAGTQTLNSEFKWKAVPHLFFLVSCFKPALHFSSSPIHHPVVVYFLLSCAKGEFSQQKIGIKQRFFFF